MDVSDLAGLGKGMEKLLELVGKGVGVVYKPRAIRKEAEAEAYRIRLIARAEAEADAEKRAVLALPADSPLLVAEVPLLQRAATRLAHEEAEKQANIENIVEHAANNIDDDVSDVPVDKTWANRFFASASQVSDELMQEVWGKVLAGEVKQPGAFSLRSMETLRNLSTAEAESFRKLCGLRMGASIIKTAQGIKFNAFDITYGEILGLRAAGLMHEADSLIVRWPVPSVKRYQGDYILFEHANSSIIDGAQSVTEEKQFEVVGLTTVGLELAALIEPLPRWDYIRAVAQHIEAKMSIKLWLADIELNPEKQGEVEIVGKRELPSN